MQLHTHLRCYLLTSLLFSQTSVYAEIQLNGQLVGNHHGIQLHLLNQATDDHQPSDQWLFAAQSNIDNHDEIPLVSASAPTNFMGFSQPLPEIAQVYDYILMKKLAETEGLRLIVNANLQASQYTQATYANRMPLKLADTHWSQAASIAIQLEDAFLLGTEFRNKPNHFYQTGTSITQDFFITWSPHARLSMTGAYTETKDQRSLNQQANWYFFGQISY